MLGFYFGKSFMMMVLLWIVMMEVFRLFCVVVWGWVDDELVILLYLFDVNDCVIGVI